MRKVRRWDDGEKHYQAADVESLMQQVLHWHLPLSDLHHWVLGIADAGSPGANRASPTTGRSR